MTERELEDYVWKVKPFEKTFHSMLNYSKRHHKPLDPNNMSTEDYMIETVSWRVESNPLVEMLDTILAEVKTVNKDVPVDDLIEDLFDRIYVKCGQAANDQLIDYLGTLRDKQAALEMKLLVKEERIRQLIQDRELDERRVVALESIAEGGLPE